MNKYKEFTITSIPFIPEVLSGLLWELDITGIQEEENFIKVFCTEESSASQTEISAQLQKLVDEAVFESFIVSEKILENKNWNEEWEKSREVIVVSDTLVIKPSFKEYSAKPNQIVITIDPKMSFGTGEHQSTKLSLLFLEKYVKKGMRILDIGTGTAVLAIASVKLGANNVIAIDNDECCFENSIENCEVNSVQEKIDVRLCEIKEVTENEFDLVAANIQRDILLQIKKEIRERIKNKGILILSGLLIQDKEEIQREYETPNFVLVDSNISGEWISMVFQYSLNDVV
jgi:ribosomal protein L11 methyltransferase